MTSLRVLLVEDSLDDAFLLERYLRQTGFEPDIHRVDGPSGLREALSTGPWDLVLSDFHLPGFSGIAALEILKATGIDIPFILVSGAIGEHTAVEAMRAGAKDYILKDNLARLGPAIRREMLEFAERKARRSAEDRQRTLENAIQAILDGTSREWGVDFFRSLVISLAKSLGFRAAAVTEIDLVAMTGRILAVHGLEMPVTDYSVAGSFAEQIVFHENASVQAADFERYVDGPFLASSGIRSMVGIRLDSRDGRPRGLLVVMDDKPIEEPALTHDLLSIFAARAGAELDRIDADRERRDAEQKLLHAQKLEALGTFAGGIAHDINNILTSIWGHAQLLELRFPDPAASDSVQGILSGCRRARDLARQILLFGRKQDPIRQPVRIEEIVEETFKLLRAWAPPSIRMEADVPQGLFPVLGDPGQLLQVLMNLCTNAVHSMDSGVGILRVRLSSVSECLMQVVVSDTGTGISQENLARIFEPFFTTKGPDKGTGLGLSVVHGIVRNHGGTIEVRSVPGDGTTFVVSLPVHPADISEPSDSGIGMPQGNGELILVVDDEPAITDLLSNLLEILGYRCRTFNRPTEALDEFRLDPDSWSAVISDFTMPGLTGKQLAQEIHFLNAGIPVLLTSGYEAFESGGDSKPGDIYAFVPKPFQAEDIARLLQKCLSGK